MANPFRFGTQKETNKDLFSTAFFTSRLPAKINEEQALTIPTVKASIELITNSISALPIYLYSENEIDGSITKELNDSRTSILNHDANNFDTAQVIKKKIVQDYLLRGKAYLSNKNGKLFHLPSAKVTEELYTDDNITIGKREFVYQGISTVTLQEHQVIVIDSGTNGLLVDSGVLFQTAIAHLDYQNSLMSNGAIPTGIVKATSRLTEAAITRLRASFDGLYKGSKNAGKTMLLEEGLDFSQLSLSPDKLGLHESNKNLISEIARVFNIPESMVNSAANKYASNEQNSIQFLTATLAPIVTAIESAFDKNLLSQIEKDLGYFFRFDTSEILRTTESEKISAVSKGLSDGLFSFNEARQKLDLPKVEKDYFVLNLGQVLKDEKTGELTVLNLGTAVQQKNNDGSFS